MFQTSRTTNRLLFSCVGAVLAFAGAARAQESPVPQPTTTTIELPRPQDFEIGIYAGGSFFKQKRDPLSTEMLPSGMVGGWIAENPTNYVGFEQNFGYMQNDLRFHQVFSGVLQSFTLSQHVYQFQQKFLFHLKPKTSAVRPYLFAGFGLSAFQPTQDAKNVVNLPVNSQLSAFNLSNSNVFAFTYGGGLKVRIANHVALRAEASGLLGRQPHYDLPEAGVPPQLYIPSGGMLNGFQVSSGVFFVFGGKQDYTVTVQPGFTRAVINPATTAAVCSNTPINFTGSVENLTPTHTPSYRWMVDGQAAGSGPTFTYTPTAGGSHRVELMAVDNITPLQLRSAAVQITVNEHTAPTITANADKTDLAQGDKAMLYPHPQAGTCPGNLTVTWAAAEGTVTGTDPATFDSSSVSFDASNPAAQTKQVTITATVTDDKGGSASAPVTVNISNRQLTGSRQDDIVFPAGNSRVNNCGKRVLIDQVYPALTSGQYSNFDVVLIGHEGNEPPAKMAGRRGRRARAVAASLARQRAENVAAVLSAGAGICPRPGIDLSRIRIATVGPNTGPDLKSACVGSTTTKERRGFSIKESDTLKDTRVEIWFVPKGATALPSGAESAQPAPGTIKTLSCPK